MSVLCCFGCLTCFGCRNIIYTVEEHADDVGHVRQTMYLLTELGEKTMPYSSPNFVVEFIRTSRKQTIVTMHVRHPRATETILFSHGNATDLGLMRDHIIDMSMRLQVNIIAYDYTGYGMSTGKSTVKDSLADAEAVLQHLIDKWGNTMETIILYGQSLGSGPSLHLARQNPRLKGIILHSAYTSGVRVIDTSVNHTKWFDIYPNIDTVRHVKCPVFVVHGTLDEDINMHHGQQLAEAAPVKYEPWFVEGAGHNNIEMHWRQQLFRKVRKFIKFCTKRQNSSKSASKSSALDRIAAIADRGNESSDEKDNPESRERPPESGSGTLSPQQWDTSMDAVELVPTSSNT